MAAWRRMSWEQLDRTTASSQGEESCRAGVCLSMVLSHNPYPWGGTRWCPFSKQWVRSEHDAQEARVAPAHLAPRLLKHRL